VKGITILAYASNRGQSGGIDGDDDQVKDPPGSSSDRRIFRV